jgi:hypothetical protein
MPLQRSPSSWLAQSASVTHGGIPELELALELVDDALLVEVLLVEVLLPLAPGNEQPGTASQTAAGRPAHCVSGVPVQLASHEQPSWNMHESCDENEEHEADTP